MNSHPKKHTLPLAAMALVTLVFLMGADFSDQTEDANGLRAAEFVLRPALEAIVDRHPYLQSVTANSLSIHWKTILPVKSHILYGTSPEDLKVWQSDEPTLTHRAELSGFEAGQTVYYQVLGPDEKPLGGLEKTTTAPTAEDSRPVRIAVFGDSGEPNRKLWEVVPGEDQLRIARQMEAAAPDLILHVGDLVYNRGERSKYDPLFFDPYRNLLGRIPFYPSLGNHDIMTDGGAPMAENFDLPVVSERFPERYYSFDWGPIHFICLDSTWLETLLGLGKPGECLSAEDAEALLKEQTDWLRRDLEQAQKSLWRVVFFHHPVYSTARPADKVAKRFSMLNKNWVPLFEEMGVDLVLNGHEHIYERFNPIRGGERDEARGIAYVVTGGGGGKVRKFAGEMHGDLTACRVPLTHHFVMLQIDGPTLRLEAINCEGGIIDSWTREKPLPDYLLGEGTR